MTWKSADVGNPPGLDADQVVPLVGHLFLVYVARMLLTGGIHPALGHTSGADRAGYPGDHTRGRTRSGANTQLTIGGARRVDEVEPRQREPFEGKEHELDELGKSIGGGRA